MVPLKLWRVCFNTSSQMLVLDVFKVYISIHPFLKVLTFCILGSAYGNGSHGLILSCVNIFFSTVLIIQFHVNLLVREDKEQKLFT